jgi:hypothetical protein
MCGKLHTVYLQTGLEKDKLDASHIFAKSAWPLVRFFLLNVVIHCRECHEWWGANRDAAMAWIEQYLGPCKYKLLLAAVTNPEPLFRDLSKVETYLKEQIRKYS